MGTSSPVPAAPVMEARRLSLAIDQRWVLRELDLTVAPNEFLAVLALGGAGKSLLFRTLTGLQQPTSGQVFWFGKELGNLSERQIQALRRLVGAVHQQGALFADLTVEENIKLPLVELTDHDPEHIRNTVEFTLEVAGLAEHRHRYPAALAAVTIRKAALARALVLGPRLLLCDDVFAGLDPKAQNQINDYLRALHILGSMTTVILTHNLRMAFRLATRVAVLAEGRIVTSGPPDDIRRSALPEVMNLLQDDGAID